MRLKNGIHYQETRRLVRCSDGQKAVALWLVPRTTSSILGPRSLPVLAADAAPPGVGESETYINNIERTLKAKSSIQISYIFSNYLRSERMSTRLKTCHQRRY